jgi:hypothetical protein
MYSLERFLKKLNLYSVPIYFVPPCTLYGMNLIFANSLKGVLGEGSLDYMHVMQLLHSLYDLVGWYEHQELHLMWESVNGRPLPNKISKAVVGKCGCPAPNRLLESVTSTLQSNLEQYHSKLSSMNNCVFHYKSYV